MAVSKKAARGTLRDLVNKIPDLDERETILYGLQDVPDASAILITTEIIDLALRDGIIAYLRKDDPDEIAALFNEIQAGFLTSFSRRIRMAYALGLFGPKTLEDLNLVRHIRNAFAHSKLAIEFATPEVAAMCKCFNIARFETERDDEAFEKYGPKAVFLAASMFLYHGIKLWGPDTYEEWTPTLDRPLSSGPLYLKRTGSQSPEMILRHRLP